MGQSAAYTINRDQEPHFIPNQFWFMCLEGGKLQSVTKVYNDLNVGVIEPPWTRFGDMRQSVVKNFVAMHTMVDLEKVKALSKSTSVWGRGKTDHLLKVFVVQAWRSKFMTQNPPKGRRRKLVTQNCPGISTCML